MKIVSTAFRSINDGLSHRYRQTHLLRSLSTWTFTDNGTINQQTNKSESPEEFDQQIFSETPGSTSKLNAIFEKLNRQQRAHDRSSSLDEGSRDNGAVNQQTNKSESLEEVERIFGKTPRSNSKIDAFFEKLNQQGKVHGRYSSLDDLEESYDTLSDGMDGKLKKAATYFEVDPDEIEKDDYSFRYDTTFWPGSTYDIKDLDLTKPAVRKPPIREEFKVTTKEVLSQADFRNVRFLANFITEAGIIIKRSKTGISAKAQRKVAREIKTARAFGLMPFTTMGTKSFVFGNTMENLEGDYRYEVYNRDMHAEPDMEGDNA